ncbi:response regulator [Marinobacter sp. C2H3]|uniref:response regulator n=1 Tax=Marinobacter sp. C2H3 TaxID=3119003 RepID=UPI00300E8F0C
MTVLPKHPMILIADDDPDDQVMIQEAFAERCDTCHLCFVANGVELMATLRRLMAGAAPLPDLLLMDLNMPLKDGRQSLVEIRATPELKGLRTVILTTSRDDDDIRFCRAQGADDYIVKPARYSELLNIVNALGAYWQPGNIEQKD